ncbi:MAG: cell division protein FtsZ [Chitinophagia bacterium]|jgi:cell division protein FtsZ
MIHFDLPRQKSSIIKVLGVGGGGSNAVNFMFDQQIEGVDFIICNTDAKAIEQSPVPNKIQLGPHLTQGLGAGANPEIGKMATEESLEEIRRILEVNTKMAFITVGMGGGTGTGGAPIIAQICKEMGILTVGIVTTPFAFEGPKRLQQAQEGIRQLKPLVDTLLVISNDKLRVQYGDLKMKEAFGKADNVLATAAKCITDIINSRGHIIVDFADVCTVMKNGGVAILGKAEVSGENRAQLAIEQALASPLLNDSDIMGAKWILININSAEGDFECTMDEMEIINNYLRQQAGPDTDVIVGMGYDETLGDKIGITLVATGFEHKDPFQPANNRIIAKDTPEKIVMVLGMEAAASDSTAPVPTQNETNPANTELFTKVETEDVVTIEHAITSNINENDLPEEKIEFNLIVGDNSIIEHQKGEEEKKQEEVEENEEVLMQTQGSLHFELSTEITETINLQPAQQNLTTSASDIFEDMFRYNESIQPAYSSSENFGLITKPTRIYEESEQEEVLPLVQNPMPVTPLQPEPLDELVKEEIVEEQLINQPIVVPDLINQLEEKEAEEDLTLQMVIKEIPVQRVPESTAVIEDIQFSEDEEQKRRAAERIQKLRNLSYNLNNPADPNNEFDVVPAYVRKNMELFGNSLTSAEQFYSRVTVGKGENDQPILSTRNTFLEGKKPD